LVIPDMADASLGELTENRKSDPVIAAISAARRSTA
jgi:hypothetical protein